MPVVVVSASIGSEYWPPALAGNAPKTGATLAMVTSIVSVFELGVVGVLDLDAHGGAGRAVGEGALEAAGAGGGVERVVRDGHVVAAALLTTVNVSAPGSEVVKL